MFLRLPAGIYSLKAAYSIYFSMSYAICEENFFFLTCFQKPLTDLIFGDFLQLNEFAFHEIKQADLSVFNTL